MITLFNRAELTSAFTMEEQVRIGDALAAAGIDYSVKTEDLTGAGTLFGRRGRGHFGSAGIREECRLQYRFFVRRQDLERARHCIGR